MCMRRRYPLLLLLMLGCCISSVSGHTPLEPDGEGESITKAIEIPDPTKSWTLYREIHEKGEAEYFKLYLYPGERLYVSVFTPNREGSDFTPSLALIGAGFTNTSEIPENLKIPEDYGVIIFKGVRPDNPEYEPFTPASYYYTARGDVTIEEEDYYYFAVHDEQTGRYGIAVGYREVFEFLDIVLLPFNLVNIHIWEYQSVFLILLPLLLVLFLGGSMIYLRTKTGATIIQATGALAGLLYAGTGFMTLYQLFLAFTAAPSTAALITLGVALLQLIPGYYLIKKSLTGYGPEYRNDRILYVLIGLLGLVAWAGFIIGPFLSMLVGLIGRRDFRDL